MKHESAYRWGGRNRRGAGQQSVGRPGSLEPWVNGYELPAHLLGTQGGHPGNLPDTCGRQGKTESNRKNRKRKYGTWKQRNEMEGMERNEDSTRDGKEQCKQDGA